MASKKTTGVNKLENQQVPSVKASRMLATKRISGANVKKRCHDHPAKTGLKKCNIKIKGPSMPNLKQLGEVLVQFQEAEHINLEIEETSGAKTPSQLLMLLLAIIIWMAAFFGATQIVLSLFGEDRHPVISSMILTGILTVFAAIGAFVLRSLGYIPDQPFLELIRLLFKSRLLGVNPEQRNKDKK